MDIGKWGNEQSEEELRAYHSDGIAPVADMAKVSKALWRSIFHPDRLTPILVWDENNPVHRETLLRAEAGRIDACFLNYVPFPRRPGEVANAESMKVWVNQVAATTQFHLSDAPDSTSESALSSIASSSSSSSFPSSSSSASSSSAPSSLSSSSSSRSAAPLRIREQQKPAEPREHYGQVRRFGGVWDPAWEEGVMLLDGKEPQTQELNKQRWRSVLSVPAPRQSQARKNQETLEQRQRRRQRMFGWQQRVDQQQLELLEYSQVQRLGLHDWQLLSGLETSLFLAHGPSSNGTHIDSEGGGSCLVFGQKVFVSWDPKEWAAGLSFAQWAHGRAEIAPPLLADVLAKFPSLRWTYVGPGCTIILPADRVHFVITLASSALVSFVSTTLPHRLVRSMVLAFAGQQPVTGTWMGAEDQSMEAVCKMFVYLRESTMRRKGQWDPLMVKVASQEWMAMRSELDFAMRIVEHVDCLPGLIGIKADVRRARSDEMIAEWFKWDTMMSALCLQGSSQV